MEVKLYVENLSYITTEDDLRTLFAKAGQVASVILVKDRNGTSKVFAFVGMNTHLAAEKAIRMLNGFNLGGQELNVLRVPIP